MSTVNYTHSMDPTIALRIARMTEWMQLAACGEEDVDGSIFFPDPDEDDKTELARKKLAAKRICWTQCPVREQCLAYAMTYAIPPTPAIMGGLTREERECRIQYDQQST